MIFLPSTFILFSIPSLFTRRLLSMSIDKSSLLACQRNAYIKESSNTVLACQKYADRESYQIILDDSVLYPEGGGQPYDLGKVNGIPVSRVVKPTSGHGVEVEISALIDVGAKVMCEVDWARRYDFMQQHTAQHLFSAVASKLFGADTVGWSLGTDSVTVDLLSKPVLTSDQLASIEDEVNAHIRSGCKVDWKVFSRDELATSTNPELQELRGMVKGAALEMEELRLVSIEGVDLNPCGGTHLQSLAEINLLKIIGTEKDRNALRVRFLAGQRALQYFHSCVAREAALSAKLSAPPSEHLTILDKLQKERKDLAKRLDTYADELAEFWGHAVVSACPVGASVLVKHRDNADLKFLLRAAAKAQEARPDVIILFSSDDGNTSNKTGSSISGPFVLFGNAAVVSKVKEPILALLGAKGGGKPGKMQGFGSKIEQVELAHDIIVSSMT